MIGTSMLTAHARGGTGIGGSGGVLSTSAIRCMIERMRALSASSPGMWLRTHWTHPSGAAAGDTGGGSGAASVSSALAAISDQDVAVGLFLHMCDFRDTSRRPSGSSANTQPGQSL